MRLLWNVIRTPILAILMLCEPVVRFVCAGLMLLGLFVSILFEISAAGPRFPFLGMVAASLGFGVVLFLYYAVIALLMR